MTEQPSNMNDHDLLVTLHTQMELVLIDIKEVKDNTVGRISILESNKMEKADADKAITEALKNASNIHSDFESRLRFIERYMWSALAIVSLAMFLLNYFHPFVTCCTQ